MLQWGTRVTNMLIIQSYKRIAHVLFQDSFAARACAAVASHLQRYHSTVREVTKVTALRHSLSTQLDRTHRPSRTPHSPRPHVHLPCTLAGHMTILLQRCCISGHVSLNTWKMFLQISVTRCSGSVASVSCNKSQPQQLRQRPLGLLAEGLDKGPRASLGNVAYMHLAFL